MDTKSAQTTKDIACSCSGCLDEEHRTEVGTHASAVTRRLECMQNGRMDRGGSWQRSQGAGNEEHEPYKPGDG